MGEAKRKQQLISVLIPERGRPEMLERTICSLIDTAGTDERYQIIVSIDTDDEAWIDREPLQHSRVTYLRRPRAITLGEKLNDMARHATGNILFFIANDMVMDTAGWPAKFRAACAKLPDGIGVPFVKDDLHPDHASYPLITRRMMEAVGFAFAPFFPYWFIDTWIDEIGIMLGERFEINVSVSAPEGRGLTHGLIDLAFWVGFFHETRPMRTRDAVRLAEIAHGGRGTVEFTSFMAALPERVALCAARGRHLSSSEFLHAWGHKAESAPSSKYAEVKAFAETQMARLRAETPRKVKIAIAVPSGRTWEAASANAVAALSAHSAVNGIQIMNLNTQSSSISHNRNVTVQIALQNDMDYIFWYDSDMVVPPDALLRLLKAGKDIVGATYCKRTSPHEVLGRFIGPRPDSIDEHLHEAQYLPGGMMLVKTEVYKKMGFPYYAEAYQFGGADGLEAFKTLARCYFHEIPPDAVLDSLDGSPFGDWIKDNYALGMDGEKFPYLSEDNFFIQRARRFGYTSWCDIRLTAETVHLGTLEVTCRMPDELKAPRTSPVVTAGGAKREGGLLFADASA